MKSACAYIERACSMTRPLSVFLVSTYPCYPLVNGTLVVSVTQYTRQRVYDNVQLPLAEQFCFSNQHLLRCKDRHQLLPKPEVLGASPNLRPNRQVLPCRLLPDSVSWHWDSRRVATANQATWMPWLQSVCGSYRSHISRSCGSRIALLCWESHHVSRNYYRERSIHSFLLGAPPLT